DWRASLGSLTKKKGRRSKKICKQLKLPAELTHVASSALAHTPCDSSLTHSADIGTSCTSSAKRRRKSCSSGSVKEKRWTSLAKDTCTIASEGASTLISLRSARSVLDEQCILDSLKLKQKDLGGVSGATRPLSQVDPSLHTFRAQEFDDESRWEGSNHCHVSPSSSCSMRSSARAVQKRRKTHRTPSLSVSMSGTRPRLTQAISSFTTSTDQTLSLEVSPASSVPFSSPSGEKTQVPIYRSRNSALRVESADGQTINHRSRLSGYNNGKNRRKNLKPNSNQTLVLPSSPTSKNLSNSAPINFGRNRSGPSVSASNWKEILAKKGVIPISSGRLPGQGFQMQIHSQRKRSPSPLSTASTDSSSLLSGSDIGQDCSQRKRRRLAGTTRTVRDVVSNKITGSHNLPRRTPHIVGLDTAVVPRATFAMLDSPTLLNSPPNDRASRMGSETEFVDDVERDSDHAKDWSRISGAGEPRNVKSRTSGSSNSMPFLQNASLLTVSTVQRDGSAGASNSEVDGDSSQETLSIEWNNSSTTNENDDMSVQQDSVAHANMSVGENVSRKVDIPSACSILVPIPQKDAVETTSTVRSDKDDETVTRAQDKPFNPRALLSRNGDSTSIPAFAYKSTSLLAIAREQENANHMGQNRSADTCKPQKNGLSGYLEHAINRRKSQARIWNDGMLTGEFLTVCVVDVYAQTYGVVIVRCCMIESDTNMYEDGVDSLVSAATEGVVEGPEVYVVLDLQTASLLTSVQDTILQIYSPWHTVEAPVADGNNLYPIALGGHGGPEVGELDRYPRADKKKNAERIEPDIEEVPTFIPATNHIIFPSRCVIFTPRSELGEDAT
ncbi:hypothetical protein SARC_11614, partial [Sphaeroforma arctica JP610]